MKTFLVCFGIGTGMIFSAILGGVAAVTMYKKSIKKVGELHVAPNKELYASFDYNIDYISKKKIIYMTISNDAAK